MKKDQIIILEDRGLILISGEDAENFLQNIITNDIKKVSTSKSIFSGIFTPQGKYLYEFFIIKSKNNYLLDCDNEFTREIIEHLSKYIIRSKVEIKDLSSMYVVGVISIDKFLDLQHSENNKNETISYRESPIFIDPRTKKLGARIISNLEKLHLTIKKLKLKIININNYLEKAFLHGIPIKGLKNLKNNLFGLEANFEELKAIDFKKGCYVGQENTARMKLKNKLRKRLFPIKIDGVLDSANELIFNDIKIGKILIEEPFPFALINLLDPDFSKFKDKEILLGKARVKIINNY